VPFQLGDMLEDSLDETARGRRIADVLGVVPLGKLAGIYPFVSGRAETTPMFDILLEDDHLAFPDRS
jgi:hypothetical protein